jgi:hypothetical protein
MGVYHGKPENFTGSAALFLLAAAAAVPLQPGWNPREFMIACY